MCCVCAGALQARHNSVTGVSRWWRRYGKGYRLSVVLRSHEAASTDSTSDTDPESKAAPGAIGGGNQGTVNASREVMAHIKQYVPSARLAARDAGNMAVVLPFDTVAQLPPLLSALESNETGHISEWGVSYATMEEVRAGAHVAVTESVTLGRCG